MIVLEVLGTPAPKGSSRAMLAAGRAINAPSGSDANRRALKGWDQAVRAAALEAIGARWEPVFVGKPLVVEIVFRLARPGGHWGKRGLKPSAPIAPATKPDLDKLIRATLDSLSGLAFDDDSRIVRLIVDKCYAAPGNEGARITVEELRAS